MEPRQHNEPEHVAQQPKYERIVMRGPNTFDLVARLPSGELERRPIAPARFELRPNGAVRLRPPR